MMASRVCGDLHRVRQPSRVRLHNTRHRDKIYITVFISTYRYYKTRRTFFSGYDMLSSPTKIHKLIRRYAHFDTFWYILICNIVIIWRANIMALFQKRSFGLVTIFHKMEWTIECHYNVWFSRIILSKDTRTVDRPCQFGRSIVFSIPEQFSMYE